MAAAGATAAADNLIAENPSEAESIKTISHLLDDKPWLCASPSQATLANTQRQSRSNSLFNN